MVGGFLLGFHISQEYTMQEIQGFTLLYWEYKDLNFHIYMAEA
tara:strand:+ start:1062 stop:1190 length:129 start_codon:yes stop_codon:yes gene_type:complete